MMRADNTETGDEDASGRRSSTGSQDSEEADMPHEDGATKGSLKTSSDNEKHLSASERKRNREKQRRNKLNQGLDELASLLYKIDPSLQTYSEAPPSHLSSSQGGWPMDFPPKDGSQTITNRVELINCALKMLKQLHRENEQRKKFLEDLAKAGLISLAHIDAALSNKPTMPAPASASVLLNQQQQDSPLIGGSFPTAAANSFVVPGAPRGGIQTTQRGAVPPPPPTSGIIRSQSGGPEEEMVSLINDLLPDCVVHLQENLLLHQAHIRAYAPTISEEVAQWPTHVMLKAAAGQQRYSREGARILKTLGIHISLSVYIVDSPSTYGTFDSLRISFNM